MSPKALTASVSKAVEKMAIHIGLLVHPPILTETAIAIAVLNEQHSARLPPDERTVAMRWYHCPHNRLEYLSILFPTSCPVKPWHFRRRKRRPPGGGGCTTCGMAGVLNRRFSSRSVAMSFCIRATMFTSISTGDPISCRSRLPSRKLSSGKSLNKGLGTARTTRGGPCCPATIGSLSGCRHESHL